MSKNEIDDFSDGSLAEIAKVVRTLRWQVQNVQEQLKRAIRHSPTHEIRTGITAARPNETYPDAGCVLPIQFQDIAFDETVGNCDALDKTAWPSKFVSARTIAGDYLAADENVLIVKTAGKTGRRWWILAGNPNCNTISFKIVSADPVAKTAIVAIQSRPPGCDSVPEETTGDTTCDTGMTTSGPLVTVNDPAGCWLNEPAADLACRWGWAEYMTPITSEAPEWQIFALCCPACDASSSSSSSPSTAEEMPGSITGAGPGPIPGMFLP